MDSANDSTSTTACGPLRPLSDSRGLRDGCSRSQCIFCVMHCTLPWCIPILSKKPNIKCIKVLINEKLIFVVKTLWRPWLIYNGLVFQGQNIKKVEAYKYQGATIYHKLYLLTNTETIFSKCQHPFFLRKDRTLSLRCFIMSITIFPPGSVPCESSIKLLGL